MEHTIIGFIEFCKSLEFTEGIDPQKGNKNSLSTETKSHTDQNGQNKGALMQHAKYSCRGNKKQKNDSKDKFCKLHHVHDHDTGDCEVLKAQACKMHANWEIHWSKQVFCDNKYNNKPNKCK